jgi:hypothetical protein
MDRTMWVAVMVAGLAVALGYGVARGFIDWPEAGVVILMLLVALSGAGTAGDATPALGLGIEPPSSRLPIGFHPD